MGESQHGGHRPGRRCRERIDATRPWAEIIGGGRGGNTFQTLVEGKVEGGELVMRVHNVMGTVPVKPVKIRDLVIKVSWLQP